MDLSRITDILRYLHIYLPYIVASPSHASASDFLADRIDDFPRLSVSHYQRVLVAVQEHASTGARSQAEQGGFQQLASTLKTNKKGTTIRNGDSTVGT